MQATFPRARDSASSAKGDALPLWLSSGIGVCYAAVGAAHLIVGVLIGAAEKSLVLAAVLILLLINLYSLDIWRARLTRWWRSRTLSTTPNNDAPL